jgi:tripartite ATP-independent transporter DctM subunit
MSPGTIVVIGFALLILLFMLRMPIAYGMTLVGFLGFIYVSSVQGALSVLAKDFWSMFSSYSLTVIPMFVFMGTIAFYSGIGGRLYDASYKFFGQQRGGLCLATIVACAGFGAMCGSTIAETAAMGKVTLPEMKKYNYDESLATACVAAAGGLAILIPPSTIFIIYGIMTEESIGKLFAAGILPGLVLTALFAIVIYILTRINPNLAPAGAKATWKERMISLSGVIEMILLFALVMGGLFVGWFTPTEAGAGGAAGALVIALVRRRLSWQGFLNALVDTTHITAMVFLIVTGATVFGRFIAVSRVPFELAEWVGGLGVSPNVIMGLIIFGYLIAGAFMDELAMITLTVPILYPVIKSLGFDGIWFGVIIVLVCEMGLIAPPVGMNVFVIKGVVPEVPLENIYRGIWPFLMADIVCAILLVVFPQIALFLPSFMSW